MIKFFFLGVGLLLVILDQVLGAEAAARCEEVIVDASDPLAMGIVRGDRGSEGFVELHPTRGISMSNDDASHQGAYGPATAKVRGGPGVEVLLFVQAESVSSHDLNRLALTELLVMGADDKTRLEVSGEEIRVTLPERVDQEGLASGELKFGATFRYARPRGGVHADYIISLDCIADTP